MFFRRQWYASVTGVVGTVSLVFAAWALIIAVGPDRFDMDQDHAFAHRREPRQITGLSAVEVIERLNEAPVDLQIEPELPVQPQQRPFWAAGSKP